MLAISSLELVAVSAWLLGGALVMWARAARGLSAAKATFLVVIMTVVPILGPVASIVRLWRSSGGGRRLRLVSAVRRRGDGMAGKFELYKDGLGKFRFRLKAGNGEIIATGEAYESKASALGGIESVRKNAADAKLDDQTG